MFGVSKKLTIVECLEKFFDGALLTKENRKLFLDLDTTKANNLFYYFEDYLNKNDEFYIPSSKKTYSRPFVWHETSESAKFIGGNVFYPPDSNVDSKTDNLRNLLLLHHQIVITDQLHYILSILSHNANYDNGRRKYEEYIDFLILNKPLIDNGILIICSDRRAYNLAPVNAHITGFEDADITEFVREQLEKNHKLRQYFFDDSVKRTLAYMRLSEEMESHEFIDTQYDLDIYRAIHNYWEVKIKCSQPSSFILREDIKLSTEKISNQDLVNIRSNDEIFANWRKSFSNALKEKSDEEFKNRMHEGIINLQEKIPSRLKGTPKSLVIGALSNTLTTLLTGNPVAGIAVGTGLGTGFELIDKSIRRKTEIANIEAENAARLHFVALLQSNFKEHKKVQTEDDIAYLNWLDKFLKKRK